MASIINDPNGRKRIMFVRVGSKHRQAIRLGQVSKAFAESFRSKVQAILADLFEGRSHSADTLIWIKGLNETHRERMEQAALIQKAAQVSRTLKPFLADYFKAITVKPSTATIYHHTERCLIEYFGEGKSLNGIGPEEADKFRQYLKDVKLSTATVSRRIKIARTMFKLATKWGIIASNPFAGVAAGSEKNRSRLRFISTETANKVLAACPDTEWKLLFALSRWGGLRCPSEHLALTWDCIDWDRGRMRVPSPKTEHHEGGAFREIPIFDELYDLLKDQFAMAEEGAVHVIARYRHANINLRTQLLRICTRAGVQPWPKLFHNLRATRQTELAETRPIHVVCAWIGNSEAVAKDHYLQVTDEHFEKSAQKAARNRAKLTENKPNIEGVTMPETPENTVFAEISAIEDGRSRPRTIAKLRGLQGRPDEIRAQSRARDSIPDEIRMKRALAVISAAFVPVPAGQGREA